MKLDVASLSITGRRASNEDSLCAEPELGFFAVADGMGGYEGGEVASQIAIGTLKQFVRRVVSGHDVFLPAAADVGVSPSENLLRFGTMMAHQRICFARVGPLARMGSTLAMIWLVDEQLFIAHVGDSRVYRVRDGKLDRLTRDHSLYEELLATGTNVGPRSSYPFAHVITRALGVDGDSAAIPDLRMETVQLGDTFLLCTDGLSELVSEQRIIARLSEPKLDEACRGLVEDAYRNGSKDNITAVLVRPV